MIVNGFALLSGDDFSAEKIKEIRRANPSIRRSDRYTAMTLLAVLRALKNAAMPPEAISGGETSLVTATGFGPQRTTVAMCDEILDYPENEILPTKFSHSVLNASAAYLGEILQITGATFAVCGFEDSFFSALELAAAMLHGGVCRRAIVVATEERAPLADWTQRLLPESFNCDFADVSLALVLSMEGAGAELDSASAPPQKAEFIFGAEVGFAAKLANGGKLSISRARVLRG